MEEFDLYLDGRLSAWGVYKYRSENNLDGWPTKSLIAVVMELGTLVRGNARSMPPFSIDDEEADEVNAWINRMRALYPQYADAVDAWYVPRGKKQRELAQERNISLSAFKARVHNAKMWLSGRLSAEITTEELFDQSLDQPKIKKLPKNENKYLNSQAVCM
jgi:hypothetical protein